MRETVFVDQPEKSKRKIKCNAKRCEFISFCTQKLELYKRVYNRRNFYLRFMQATKNCFKRKNREKTRLIFRSFESIHKFYLDRIALIRNNEAVAGRIIRI